MNKSGIIFPLVMWLLLTVTALVFVQRQFVHQDALLAAYGNQRVEALANAFSGVAWSQHVIGTLNRQEDTFYIKDIHPTDPQWIDKFMLMPDMSVTDGSRQGIGDESGKINLNSINLSNALIMEKLLMYYGVKQAQAHDLSLMIVNWRSTEGDALVRGGGNQLRLKKKPFESIDELRFLPGFTSAIFMHLKDNVTVYPKEVSDQELKINILTAPLAVRNALAMFLKEQDPNFKDREMLTLWQRAQWGADNKPFTADDGTAGLSEEDKIKIISPYVHLQSRVYHVIVKGMSPNRRVNVYLEAFLERDVSVVTEGAENTARVKILELRQIRP